MHETLNAILASTRTRIARAKRRASSQQLLKHASMPRGGFSRALRKKGLSVIAECKRATPSKGRLGTQRIQELAAAYEAHADAVSVLTEPHFFKARKTDPPYLRAHTTKPLLKKDFIIDAYQLAQARAESFDAVLLISSLLPGHALKDMLARAKELQVETLVEAHSKEEILHAHKAGARVIGINNRDLNTMNVKPGHALSIAQTLPKQVLKHCTLVAESGIQTRQQMQELGGVFDAVLVGSALVQARSPLAKLKELQGKPLLKVCGITNHKDAHISLEAGADFIGFNFYKKSPRYVTPKRAAAIAQRLPQSLQRVGVFVKPSGKQLSRTVRTVGLDAVQVYGKIPPSPVPVIEAVRVQGKNSIVQAKNSRADYVLLDAYSKDALGGTGTCFNHALAKTLKRPFFLAGGLTPKNVAGAVKQLQPYAVDVCSGVERTPGKKDEQKLRAFAEAIK